MRWAPTSFWSTLDMPQPWSRRWRTRRTCHRPGAFGHPLCIRPRKIEEYAYLSADDTARVTHIAAELRVHNETGDRSTGTRCGPAKKGSRADLRVRRSPSRQVAFADFLAEEGEDLQAYGRWCAG